MVERDVSVNNIGKILEEHGVDWFDSGDLNNLYDILMEATNYGSEYFEGIDHASLVQKYIETESFDFVEKLASDTRNPFVNDEGDYFHFKRVFDRINDSLKSKGKKLIEKSVYDLIKYELAKIALEDTYKSDRKFFKLERKAVGTDTTKKLVEFLIDKSYYDDDTKNQLKEKFSEILSGEEESLPKNLDETLERFDKSLSVAVKDILKSVDHVFKMIHRFV